MRIMRAGQFHVLRPLGEGQGEGPDQAGGSRGFTRIATDQQDRFPKIRVIRANLMRAYPQFFLGRIFRHKCLSDKQLRWKTPATHYAHYARRHTNLTRQRGSLAVMRETSRLRIMRAVLIGPCSVLNRIFKEHTRRSGG